MGRAGRGGLGPGGGRGRRAEGRCPRVGGTAGSSLLQTADTRRCWLRRGPCVRRRVSGRPWLRPVVLPLDTGPRRGTGIPEPNSPASGQKAGSAGRPARPQRAAPLQQRGDSTTCGGDRLSLLPPCPTPSPADLRTHRRREPGTGAASGLEYVLGAGGRPDHSPCSCVAPPPAHVSLSLRDP